MIFFRKSLFWIIALVVLGGGFYFFDDRAREAERADEARLRLLPFAAADVSAFWIAEGGGQVRARAARTSEGWWLTEPTRAKGDDQTIEKLLQNIAGSRKDAVLFEDPTPEKLAELGLDAPGLELGLFVGGDSTVIRFGDKGPTHNVAYAMFEGDPRVYRIHSDVREQSDIEIHDLRDKTVLSFDPIAMARFELERKDADNVVVLHDRGHWDMAEPEAARASMNAVLETLYLIRNSEVKAFIDEAPADLAPYGLDSPAITVTITTAGSGDPVVLSIGAKDRKRRGYFAMTAGAANVFLVEETLVNGLRADAGKWKNPDNGA